MESENNSAARLKSILRERELWLLIAIAALYCYRTLFLGETFFYRDLYDYFMPQKRLIADIIKSGEMPLWDPYLHGGQPLLADPNSVVVYPTNLFYLIFPFFTAFNLDIAFHLALCLVSTYCLARVIGFQKAPSLVAAFVYGFCGFTLSSVNLLYRFLAFCYVPLLLMFWHLYLKEAKRKWLVLATIAGSLSIFAGAPEMTAVAFLICLGWSLLYPYPNRSRKQIVIHLVFLGIFVAAFAAVQIIPTIEILRQSFRTHQDFHSFTTWSVPILRLPELIFSKFLGRTDALSEADYWGKILEGVPYSYILSIYFGLPAIAMAFASGTIRGTEELLPLRLRRFLLLFSLACLLLSLGHYLPGFYFVYEYVPVINWFRYPIKFVGAIVLPISILAGFATESFLLRQDKAPIRSQFLIVLWTISFVLIVFLLLFHYSSSFSAAIQESFFSTARSNIKSGLEKSFLQTTAVCLAITLIFQYRKLTANAVQPWLFAMIIFLDLFLPGKSVNPSAPRNYFEKTPALAQIVQKERKEGRLYRDESPTTMTLSAPSNDVLWQNIWYLEVLNDYSAHFYKIPIIYNRDFDHLAQFRLMHLKTTMESLPWDRKIPLLSIGSVSLILTDQRFKISGITPLTIVHNPSNLLFYLYRNEAAIPAASFVSHAFIAQNPSEAFHAVLDPKFDPKTNVIVEGVWRERVEICGDSIIDKLKEGYNYSVWSTQTKCGGYMVFSLPYYSGWKIYVDDEQVPLLRANYAFSAIFLPPGNHKIERHYQPLSVKIGGAISLLTILLLLFYSRRPAR